ncbi:hypothetical protein B0H65DRAFT_160894 [Neurospora tetraspora]|uniref:Uncharacterized protein n=1 Tax=Neurospora tetraspora TaxID=94610 RepID=A0AAE0JI95_9PEZI|nr:hypothetical protein B0H65DRAFT_160894 [Neurospora tetraspora]
MTCVALASGIAKHVLRGKYVDVGQDLEDILAQAEAINQDENLYSLHTSFLGGLGNGGTGAGAGSAGMKEGEEGVKRRERADGGKAGGVSVSCFDVRQ